MITIWDNYKTLKAAQRQAERNRKRGNAWIHIRQRIGGRFALKTTAEKGEQ